MTKPKCTVLLLALALLAASCMDPAAPIRDSLQRDAFDSDAANRITLTYWHNYSGEDLRSRTMRALVAEFQETHPGITVESQAIPTDAYRPWLHTVAAADEMPDIFTMWPGMMTREFADGGLIQPIDDLLDGKPSWKQSFLPGSFDLFTVGGRIYGAPTALTPTSFLFYNKEILARCGVEVPRTWQELIDAVKTLRDAGVTPILFGNKSAWSAPSSYLSAITERIAGADWLLAAAAGDGSAFTEGPFLASLDRLLELKNAGAFEPDFNSVNNTQAEQRFAKGEGAMLVDGGWALTQLAATADRSMLERMELTVLPPIPGGKGAPQATSGVVGTGLGVNAHLKGAELAAAHELIYALTGPAAQRAILDSSQLVSYKLDPDPGKVSPIFIKAHKLAAGLRFTPVYDVSLNTAGAEAMNSAVQQFLDGMSAEEAAARIRDVLTQSQQD